MLTPGYVIHPASSANVTAYTYTHVVVGSGNTAVTINGTAMNLAASTDFECHIQSISSNANVYLIGVPINFCTGDANLGSRL